MQNVRFQLIDIQASRNNETFDNYFGTKMSTIQEITMSAFMQGMNHGMMISQMPPLIHINTFAPGSCVGECSPCREMERQPQEDEGAHITDEEVTEFRFELHEYHDARFVEALDDEDVRKLVNKYAMKYTCETAFDALVRTLESKYRITKNGEPIEAAAEVTTIVSNNTTNQPTNTVTDVPENTLGASLHTAAWHGAWSDAITDEIRMPPKPAIAPTPSSNGTERTAVLLDAIFESSAIAALAPTPAPTPTLVASVEEWTEVAAPAPAPRQSLFGSNAFAWCRVQTGSNFLALNTRFKNWWSVKRPARHMYCGAKRPMIPYTPAFGEFKYYIDNLPHGELSLHDIREMISAVIPVLDVFRPIYPDPMTGKMIAGHNIKVTVPAQFNGVSAQEALSMLQAAPINFNGAAMRIQRHKGY